MRRYEEYIGRLYKDIPDNKIYKIISWENNMNCFYAIGIDENYTSYYSLEYLNSPYMERYFIDKCEGYDYYSDEIPY